MVKGDRAQRRVKLSQEPFIPTHIHETHDRMDLTTFNLKPLNLLIFPDWNQPEESLYLELAAIIKSIVTHRDRHNLALLIDSTEISEDSELGADLILSGILMNLCMEEDLEPTDEPEIILLENLSQSQWQTLLPQVQYRIKLTAENQIALALSGAEIIPLLELDRLGDITLVSPASIALSLANTLYYQGRYEEAIKQYQRFFAIPGRRCSTIFEI